MGMPNKWRQLAIPQPARDSGLAWAKTTRVDAPSLSTLSGRATRLPGYQAIRRSGLGTGGMSSMIGNFYFLDVNNAVARGQRTRQQRLAAPRLNMSSWNNTSTLFCQVPIPYLGS